MRIIKNKRTKLGFGKYRDMTLEAIREYDQSYVAWLRDNDVIYIQNKQDRDWYMSCNVSTETSLTSSDEHDMAYYGYPDSYMGDSI